MPTSKMSKETSDGIGFLIASFITWAAILSGPFWTWLYATLVGISPDFGVRAALSVVPLAAVGLTAFLVIRRVARSSELSAGPITAVRAWIRAEKSSRPWAFLLSLPLAFSIAGAGLIHLPELSRGTSAIAFGTAAIFAGIGGIFAGREAVRSAQNAFLDGDAMARRIAAVLSISPETLAAGGRFYGDGLGRITIRPVPPQAISHLPNLEAALAIHMLDCEVESASVDAVILAPASAETRQRRALAEQSGGLITGLDTDTAPGAGAGTEDTIDLTDL